MKSSNRLSLRTVALRLKKTLPTGILAVGLVLSMLPLSALSVAAATGAAAPQVSYTAGTAFKYTAGETGITAVQYGDTALNSTATYAMTDNVLTMGTTASTSSTSTNLKLIYVPVAASVTVPAHTELYLKHTIEAIATRVVTSTAATVTATAAVYYLGESDISSDLTFYPYYSGGASRGGEDPREIATAYQGESSTTQTAFPITTDKTVSYINATDGEKEFTSYFGVMLVIQKASSVKNTMTAEVTFTAEQIHGHDGMMFEEWTATDSLPTTSGNYCLASDVTLSAQWNAPDGIHLCLNGHSATLDARATAINVQSGYTLTLYDCTDSHGAITGNTGCSNYGTVTVHGGKIIGSGSYGMINYGTFTINDGTVAANASYIGVWNFNGTVTMYGGSISGTYGILNEGTATIYGGTVTGKATGSNYGISSAGTLTIYDGTVSGSICIGNGGTLTISGGSISGNYGIYNYKNGTAAISQTAGKTTTIAGSSYGIQNRGSVSISGGTVSGAYYGVREEYGYTTSLSVSGGIIKCTNNENCAVSWSKGTVTPSEGLVFYGSTTVDGEPTEKIDTLTTDNCTDYKVLTVKKPAHTHCLCGDASCNETGDGHGVVTLAQELTDTDQITSSGTYYLTGDITAASQIWPENDSNVIICLNGYSISFGWRAAIFLNMSDTTVTICDCNGAGSTHYGYWDGDSYTISETTPSVAEYDTLTGGIITGGYNGGYGAAYSLTSNTLNLYGGNIAGNRSDGQGGGVGVDGGTFNMYGGAVVGNYTGAWGDGHGGGVYVNGTFNMYGGIIANNKAINIDGSNNYGGGVYICYYNEREHGTFNMYGGSVTGNTSESGKDIYSQLNGEFVIGKPLTENVSVALSNGALGTTVATFANDYTGNDTDKAADLKKITYEDTAFSLALSEDKTKIVLAEKPPHTHTWEYSASGATVTAVCTGDGTCDYGGTDLTLTVIAPEKTVFGDGENANATLSGTSLAGVATLPAITYVGITGTSYAESTTAPTDVGQYTAMLTVGGVTARVDYAVASNAPTYTITIPATVTLGETATVTAERVSVGEQQQVAVKLTATGDAFTLTNGGSGVVEYTVTRGGTAVNSGDTVLLLTADSAETESVELTFGMPPRAVFAGVYTGTVTFTVSVEDVE